MTQNPPDPKPDPSGGDRADVQVVLCTAPPDHALTLARTLLQEKLCACVNVVPGVRSLYWWKGEITEDGEALLVIKTTASLYDRLEKRIAQVHPYTVPEVLALPVGQGAGSYLAWVRDSTAS